jgi:hypothetical protein
MTETEKLQVLEAGDLTISVGSESVFLGQAVPIEVRDSRHRLVGRTTSSNTLKLAPGLYEISAVLQDGRRHSATVDVVAGKQTPVTLTADEGATAAEPDASSYVAESSASVPNSNINLGSIPQNRFTRRMFEQPDADVQSVATVDASLVEARGATLVRQTRTLHIFQCLPSINEVPTAGFAVGGRHLVTSLPISPEGGSPSGSCAVRFEAVGSRVRAQAWITPQRTVANALQNMLASNYLLQAARVADDAAELLSSKYEDPTGAALGALLLYKTGQLARFENWVRNLARSFDWLPDGKILLARLQTDRERSSPQMLDLCLQAAKQRPLFAECHALLLELLRRWPGSENADARANAVAQLSSFAPYVNSDSICFSHWVPTSEEL